MAYGIYSDLYVLVEDRRVGLVERFLDSFLPDREECADEYEVPQYSSRPTVVYKSARELMTFLAENPTEVHAIYWRTRQNEDPRDAMVFYTKDGCAILGLSIESEEKEALFLEKLRQFSGSRYCGVAYEQAPPDTKTGFLDFIGLK